MADPENQKQNVAELPNESGGEEKATPAKPEDSATSENPDEAVSSPDFPNMKVGGEKSAKPMELNRFHDVQVTISAELGRTSIAIQDLMNLTEGAVFELNRSITAPVELIAQGVPLGNGEVVVVDDSFAIRIKEIYASPS